MGISQANGNHCSVMRYCPVCYQEDLQLHGEPYWHRSHQLPDMQICTKHRCWLVDTDVAYNSTRQQELFPASFTMQLKKQSAEPVPGCLLALDSLLHDTLDSSFDYRDGSVYHAVLDCALRSRGWRSLTGGRTYATKIENALLNLYGIGGTLTLRREKPRVIGIKCVLHYNILCRQEPLRKLCQQRIYRPAEH